MKRVFFNLTFRRIIVVFKEKIHLFLKKKKQILQHFHNVQLVFDYQR